MRKARKELRDIFREFNPYRSHTGFGFAEGLQIFWTMIGLAPIFVVLPICLIATFNLLIPPTGKLVIGVSAFLFVTVVSLTIAYGGYKSIAYVADDFPAYHRQYPWKKIILAPFYGFLSGCMAGTVGGIWFLVIGAIPGFVIGGIIGSIAFSYFHVMYAILSFDGKISRLNLYSVSIGGIGIAISCMLSFSYLW